MKITKVDVYQQQNPDRASWRPVFCRIHTDEGVYGDGEAALCYGIAAPAAFGMIKDLATLIIGMNPLDNEVIWDKLYKCTFWGQNGGPVVFAGISAIDIALWD
ncbi:mandelate racemase/muconate lactonizing enzyme family protein, partial [Pyramidobacter sp. SM-530-WT-4B]|nr:mandelate racemase/muconate lactonizing enzyme family protein [Pyramidobacter porci]